MAAIDYKALCDHLDRAINIKTLSKLPTAERDLALVCDKQTTNGEILDAIASAKIKNLASVELFDVYTGEHILSTKKSMAYRLTFSSNEKTLEVEEVDNYVRKILNKLDAIGVKLR